MPPQSKPHGRTLWDVLDATLRTRTGVVLVGCIAIVVPALLWLFAHIAAEPGSQVSVAGGIVKYVKPRDSSLPSADRLRHLEELNSELTSRLKASAAEVAVLREQLSDHSASPQEGSNQALGERIRELEDERNQLRRGANKVVACTKENELTESLRQTVSACELRALKAENPPSVFVLTVQGFSSVVECKDRFSGAFGKVTSGQAVKNYDSSVGVDSGRYFIYANCSNPSSSHVLAAGPEYVESEKLARLVGSYVLAR
jgi:hypothetical protein